MRQYLADHGRQPWVLWIYPTIFRLSVRIADLDPGPRLPATRPIVPDE